MRLFDLDHTAGFFSVSCMHEWALFLSYFPLICVEKQNIFLTLWYSSDVIYVTIKLLYERLNKTGRERNRWHPAVVGLLEPTSDMFWEG